MIQKAKYSAVSEGSMTNRIMKKGREYNFFSVLKKALTGKDDSKYSYASKFTREECQANLTQRTTDFIITPQTRIHNALFDDSFLRRAYKSKFFSTTEDVPRLLTKDFILEVDTDYYDMDYELAFQQSTVDMDNGTFDIPIAHNNVKFRSHPQGKTIVVDKYTATNTNVECLPYTCALEISDELMRKRQIDNMVEAFDLMRHAYYLNRSDGHYSLLKAAANANSTNATAYDNTASVQLDRDVNTLNSAASNLVKSLKDKGYHTRMNLLKSPILIYCSSDLTSRIERATRVLISDVAASRERLNWMVMPRYTLNDAIVTTPTTAVMVFPRHRNRTGNFVDLDMAEYPDRQQFSYVNAAMTYWGASVSENLQCINVAFA